MLKHLLYYICFTAIATVAEQADVWKGKWFPNDVREAPSGAAIQQDEHGRILMGVQNPDCDDAKRNLSTDFDPYDVRHSTVYLCLDNRHDYRGDYNMEPLITLYDIPDSYVAIHKCMNTSIEYDERIPTFGTHRPLWPRYGEYKYVPTQRWLHNAEHGAIIALYHPCANKDQVEQLKRIVKSCLYRHVITPSVLPSKDRPFALVAWGALLEFSVLQREVLEDFIREHALKGPEQTARDGQYDHLLLAPAEVVSTQDDAELCPKLQHRRRD
ncbi:uncharacterized protein LOC109400667 isoform X1 [Aedes albopictus]|uniref:Secreted protein n=2 Tax=Aedes albopictus TaxID=7160 RepID=A0ABM1YTD0_AEDAL|nr:uncharacterized protein LOC109400667 isoform X1 [Aedes albopictus]